MSFRMGVCCMTAMAGGKKFPNRLTKPKIWRRRPMRVHLGEGGGEGRREG
jgi:hypothetical protein